MDHPEVCRSASIVHLTSHIQYVHLTLHIEYVGTWSVEQVYTYHL